MSLAGTIGRRGRAFVIEDSAFATLTAISASNAFRHLDMGFSTSPFNFVDSAEKKQSPGLVNEQERRETAAWDLKSAYLIPSGVLNTAPEADLFLQHGFGAKRSAVLSTTVASSPTTSGATLTSAATLTIGDMVAIFVTGGSAPGTYVRRIATVNTGTGVVTWAPALPQAPSTSDVVKAGITYNLISGEASKSLSIYHYVNAFKRAVSGAVIDSLKLMFNANDDYKFAASGPAARHYTSGVSAAPGTFTTVGAKPISGISGRLEVGTAVTAYKALKVELDIKNGYEMRNESVGYATAEEFYRSGRRSVGLSIDARVEDETVIYDNAESATPIPVVFMAGTVSGKIFAMYIPSARFDVPDTPDGEGALTWSFSAKCKESADGANDEVIFAAL